MPRARPLAATLTALVVLAVPMVARAQPTVTITSVPAYGTSGTLHGQVSGVPEVSTVVAAPYIQVEGSGWWTKPTFAQPTVPLNSDGTFEVNVTTGGLDPYATLYGVHLLPVGETPPQAAGLAYLPDVPASLALASHERYGRTLAFGGYDWGVKSSPDPVGPGSNRFSLDPADVWVDASDRLHVTVHEQAGAWYATEVILTEPPGYGQYLFQTSSRVDALDSNLVFGGFTWDGFGDPASPSGHANRELDFEDSRWGVPADPENAQFVVQPWDAFGNRHRFALPDLSGDARLTRVLLWEEGRLRFLLLQGHYGPGDWTEADVVESWEYRHDPGGGLFVPEPGDARWRFNLWVLQGRVPAGDGITEVVVDTFAFDLVTVAWDGAAGPGWDVGGTDNWTHHGAARPYFNPDHVVFDDSAASAAVEVTETVHPASVLVNSDTLDFAVTGAGAVAGGCALTKRGTSTLVLASANAYTGGTVIEAGTVVAEADGALGAGSVTLGSATAVAAAALLAGGPVSIDNEVTVRDDGDPAANRTLGGDHASGAAVFAGSVTVGKALLLTAEPDGDVRLDGYLDNTAGHTLVKTGGGTVVLNGPQAHGPGAVLQVTEGCLVLASDASGTGSMEDAYLEVYVGEAELQVAADQHLDTLDVGAGGLVRLTGAGVVVVRHLVIGGVDLGPATLTPEPATLALLAAGALALLRRHTRRARG